MTKLEFVENWFHRVWWEEDVDAIRQLFVPTTSEEAAHGLAKSKAMGTEDYIAFHQAFLSLIKEVKITVDKHIVQGDDIAVTCTVNALDRNSDKPKPLSMKGVAICTIRNGKMVSAENFFDFISFFEGLGFLPQDTLATCFSGQRVC
jgi:ketosteroid isomerase-like protein